MKILQNLACLELTINPADNRVTFNKDILRDKKITSMYLFGSTEDVVLLSPFKEEMIAQVSEIDDLSMFLNLFDKVGKNFIHDLSHKLILLDTESGPTGIIEYEINRIIDFEKSYFFYKTAADSFHLLLYVLYQNQNFQKFTDDVNGSITVHIPITAEFQDTALSEFIDFTLKGKKIKKIIPSGNLRGFLNIVGVNNYTLENIPSILLADQSPKEFYLDGIEINFEKSFYLHRGNFIPGEDVHITFIY